jgi:hypothetical protein
LRLPKLWRSDRSDAPRQRDRRKEDRRTNAARSNPADDEYVDWVSGLSRDRDGLRRRGED